MFDPDRPLRALNDEVAMQPEALVDERLLLELSPVQLVRWVQCPRCRARFWYAVWRDTESWELQQIGMRFRQRLIGEACEQHRCG